MQQKTFIEFKITTLGDTNVGKTTFIQQYAMQMRNLLKRKGTSLAEMQSFQLTKFAPTIGVDFYEVVTHYDKFPIRLTLWDTSGQERFASLTKSYCRNSNAVLLLFDLTKRSSFENISKWLQVARNDVMDSDGVIFVMIGNKSDLVSATAAATTPTVTYEEASQFARDQKIFYLDNASAMTSDNLLQAFSITIQLLMFQWKSTKRNMSSTVTIPITISDEVWYDLNFLNQDDNSILLEPVEFKKEKDIEHNTTKCCS